MVHIKRGDIVTVVYSNGNATKGCEVLYAPMAAGEMWYFRSISGEVWAQNPLSSELHRIIKEREGRA